MSKLAMAYGMKKRAHVGKVEKPEAEEAMPAGDEAGDVVDRIMKKRKGYSEGGMVANDVGVAEADKLPAEYDDLVLRDDLESSYDGANSGDELGNSVMDENDRDLIARIMRSRAQKDRMPRPA